MVKMRHKGDGFMAGSKKTLLRLLAKAAQLLPVILMGNNLLLHCHLRLQMPYSSSKELLGKDKQLRATMFQGCIITWP